MHFNVSQMLKESIGSTRSYEVNEDLSLDDEVQASHIIGSVKLLRTDQGIWVTAELESTAVCSCSRCLGEFEQLIHMSIEDEYLPTVDVASGAKLNYSREDENFLIDKSHVIDMAEAVRQYYTLNLPMKPVCRENCKGICLTCGVNLNEAGCVCDKRIGDARWDALLELVSDNNDDD